VSLQHVSTDEAPPPSGCYSQAVIAGNLGFLAGQGPFDRSGRLVEGSATTQTTQVLENLDAVARAAGASLASAVRIGVYLRDLEMFDAMDAAYRAFFTSAPPARTTIQSNLEGFEVEADAVVWLGP
jgi:2-iminobutanoate/2-iminopropanoate deaminase